MELLKGKLVADEISDQVKSEVNALKEKGIDPKLAIIRVGERPDDMAYEKSAVKRMEKCGISYEVIALKENIPKDEFLNQVKKVNEDKSVNGILLFKPLPKELEDENTKFIIFSEKDIDSTNPINWAGVLSGDKNAFPPCTSWAVMEILKYYNIDIRGKKVAVIGRSQVVGKPLAMLLINADATVTVCHSKTKDIKNIALQSDIIIAAAGKAGLVKGDWLPEGAVVIDVGINFDDEGKMCGDVAFDECEGKNIAITPVPGGVGAVTTSVLAAHTIKACRIQNGIE